MDSDDYTEALISTRPLIVRRRVLWGECDPAGVVYTPRFADYGCSARYWFMRRGLNVADGSAPSETGPIYPMRAMSFDFMSFLAADDIFDMRVSVIKLGTTTFSTQVDASHLDGRPSFRVTMTTICVDGESRKALALPDDLKAALRSYQADSAL